MDKWNKLKGKAVTACGGILKDPSKYSYREYQGMRIYFCNDACLQEFDENPDQFMSGKVLHPVGRDKE